MVDLKKIIYSQISFQAVGNSIEFCFAVFLFFNGGWILFFESGASFFLLLNIVIFFRVKTTFIINIF